MGSQKKCNGRIQVQHSVPKYKAGMLHPFIFDCTGKFKSQQLWLSIIITSLIMQDLYEVAYAFNPNYNMVAYCVYVMIPRQFLPCTGTLISDLEVGQSSVLVVEEGGDVLPFLAMNGNDTPNEVGCGSFQIMLQQGLTLLPVI